MIIHFEGIKNVRDLGNIKNSQGLYVRSQRLLRGADLCDATGSDLELLKNQYDICAVVDFRDTASARKRTDRRINGAAYYSFPALSLMNFASEDEVRLFDEAIRQDPLGMLYKAYRTLAEDTMAHKAYRSFFYSLLSANGHGVFWHCTQGKDRTGIAAILLLSALDVPLCSIEEDYLLTNQLMQVEFDAVVNTLPNEEAKALMRTEMFVRPDCFELYIQIINERFGGMDNYLENMIGVSGGERDKLKELYLCQKRN